jgi:hypothetical protein
MSTTAGTTRATLSSLLSVNVHPLATHRWAEARLAVDNREVAALAVAWSIAQQRCGGAPQYFTAWSERHAGGPPHSTDMLACLEAFLGSESIGTRASPAHHLHLEGFVAEHIWYLLTVENAVGFAPPVRVDGPDWSVTDSGGDGLAIYRNGDTLAFRLWESKAHTGSGSVDDVVTGACRQITSRAMRYLARFSKIGQHLSDADLQHFYGLLPEMWRRGDRQAGFGVSVATTSTETERCFDGLPSYWSFTHDDQRQGLVVLIDDFGAFAETVREQLWKGL